MLPGRRRRLTARRRRFRRRHGAGLAGLLVVIGVAVLIGALARGGGSSPAAQQAPSTAATPLPLAAVSPAPTPVVALPAIHPDRTRLEPAEVVKVVDGDTIDVRIGGREERVRYYGIDTPERGDPCFSEATVRNRQLVAQNVLLLPDARERDRYGRLLRYVFDASGASVDAGLIAEGLGHAWRADGAYKGQMISLEAQAQSAGVGCLWSTAAP